ncbi:MAG: ABC transporter permease [Bacteroidota bacterium]
MLKSYFKIALRNILKYKFYSAINIFGLTVGITGCLLILLYINDELSYDKFHSKSEQIYRVGLHGKLGGQEAVVPETCPPLSQAMIDEIPEVEEAVRIRQIGEIVFRFDEKAFTEEKVFHADSNFFEFFDFELIEGDPKTALKEPNKLVLTEQLARKYFGDESPVGKIMSIGNGNTSVEVTGVVKAAPSNSHVKYSALLSMSSLAFSRQVVWLSNSFHTYFVLNEKATTEPVEAKLDEMVKKYVGPDIQRFIGQSLEEFEKNGGIYGYFVEPLEEIHLYSDVQGPLEPGGDIAYIYIFGAAGLFILIIACINFMNLSTARSAGRAKEVGLRKTLGSFRSAMVNQFLLESMIYSIIAGLLAFLATYLLLPYFNLVAGKTLSFGTFQDPMLISAILGMILFVGLLAGSYPAFYLTSFNVVEVLKGKVRASMKSGMIRSSLVVFQFGISVLLIICTSLVYEQLQYFQHKNLGFDKDKIMVLYNTNLLGTNNEAFKNDLISKNGIQTASYSNHVIPGTNNTTVFRAAASENDHIMSTYFTDYDHLETFGFELVEGRYFSRDFPSDSNAVVINQAVLDEVGWETGVGQELIDFDDSEGGIRMKIIGVVKDFNFESLKNEVRPMVLKLLTFRGNNMTVRFDTDDPQAAISTVEETWKQHAPNQPFQYTFLDEDFDALFREEQRLGKVFSILTSVAIFIACLGLFALAAFMAEQRTKEIGIRKAMGATTFSLTSLLSREFTKLVLIAIVIAVGPAYFIIDRWLDEFAFKIDIGVEAFILGGLSALIIAWVTVSYQSLKAAKSDPVKSLRYE